MGISEEEFLSDELDETEFNFFFKDTDYSFMNMSNFSGLNVPEAQK